jgi:hypothetical protein
MILFVAVGALALLASLGCARTAAGQTSSFEGVWKSGDTMMRITVNGSEARGMFLEVSPAARALGFKAGDVVLVATVVGNDLHGMQTLRYSGVCHPNGRKVPIIGHVLASGQTLVTNFYNLMVDAFCTDTGQYSVGEDSWQRVSGR